MKVLILGLGSIAKKHINALEEIDSQIEIYALRSSSSSNSYSTVKNLYSDEELFNYKFDFAILSTPTALHKEGLELLSKLNCPLFIEKPLYHDLSIEEMVKKINDQGVITYIACNLRFLDCILYIKKYLEDKEKRINEINIYCGSYLPGWRQGIDFRKSYSALPELGGGVHLDLVHEIDYVFWLFGKPTKTRAILSRKSDLQLQSIDYANYCFEYPMFNVSIILNYYRRDSKRTMELVFNDETLIVNLIENTVKNSNNQILFQSNQNPIETYTSQMKYFIDKISLRQKTFNDINDAYTVLGLTLMNNYI